MLSINTNLSSLIAQRSLKISSNKLNTAIERMSTGFKINHSSDNAANYSISTNMSTQISALDIAEDNTCMGVDLLTTADSTLGLISDKLQRLRTLAVQSSNGTYGDKSKQAINQEANALINEMQRLHATTEYNGKKILGDDNPQGGFVNNSSNTSVTFTPRSTASLKALGEIEDATVALADGTYSISSAEELAQLAEMTNAGLISEGDEFVLANDIDLIDYTSGEGWVPIGTSSNKFSGTFDGNGHTIKNLYINRPSTNMQGLFGDSKGNLKNIHIIDAKITGNVGIGILAGVQRNMSSTINCTATGKILGYGYSIGGLIGQADGVIKTCHTNVILEAEHNVGGLIGTLASNANVELVDCSSNSQVKGAFGLGGFIGVQNNNSIVKIKNCYTNTVLNIQNTTTTDCVSGGFLGSSKGTLTVEHCSSKGNIIASATTDISTLGGFLGGQETGSIKFNDCYTTVAINIQNSTTTKNIGGFCGQLNIGNSTITNCYATGDISIETSPTTRNIGGFVGYIASQKDNNTQATIENCYNKNKIEVSDTNTLSRCSGFIGYVNSTGAVNIKNCSTLTNPDSDILSICNIRDVNSDFSIENSYYNKEFENTGLNLFSDETGNAIDQDLNAQVKTCATDNPFKFYFNQQTGLQVGTASGKDSRISVDTTCSLNYMNILRNIGLQEDDYLSRIDELLAEINEKQVHIGAGNNRLLSAIEEITIRRENLVSSRSTLRDADIADVSSSYIQQQILQQASATLLSTANQSPSIALQLI